MKIILMEEICNSFIDTQNIQSASWRLNGVIIVRGGSKTAETSKMERFVIIVNGLTIITKLSILDVAALLDALLIV